VVKFGKMGMLLSGVLAGLVLAAGALAAGLPPAYQGEGPLVQQQVGGTEGASNTLGQLPFTGLDLALIVGGGLLLVIAGVSIRRAVKRTS
jgi:hypothetical protein